MNSSAPAKKTLSLARNFKLGTFHIGSSLADVLGSGVWNRIMIYELGYAATPVGFLLALRYFLAPFAAWAGERSDHTNWYGYRRLPWVWSGRLAMVFGYWLVAFSTIELVRYGSEWWLGIVAGFVIASLGQVASGATFLALVYDRASADQRGRAVGIVWTLLLAGYAIAGILFSRLLPEYREAEFVGFFAIVGLIMVAIWGFATWGEETPQPPAERRIAAQKPSFIADLKVALAQPGAQSLALFICITFLAGFMQDTILEPFGGKVFAMSVGETSRFQAYWGTMAILSSFAALWLYRRMTGNAYQSLARWGVYLLIVTFGLLALTANTGNESLLRPSLLLLGLGYGLWNIGTVGLMVKNSRESNAGLDLGVWTVVSTVCRGAGVLLGAVLFDLLASQTSEVGNAFAIIFALEALLLVVALPILNKVTIPDTPLSLPTREGELVLSSSMD
jgi:BCD family chlorophyll transporter-like MFS transporter